MAYKFQLGAAVLSGSINVAEGAISGSAVSDTLAASIVAEIDNGEIAIAKLAANTISGKSLGSNLDALSVDDSSIEYSAGSAYNGSAASTIRVKASGVTNAMLAGSIANAKLANSTISGVALGSNLNSLSKATNGGVNFSSYNGSAAVSNLQLDLSDLAAAAVNVGADSIAIVDADDDSSKKESIADLMTAVANSPSLNDGSKIARTPFAFGKRTVLSAFGSTMPRVVSFASATPSNVKDEETLIVVESTVVVVPCTVKSPAMITVEELPPSVRLLAPIEAPIERLPAEKSRPVRPAIEV